MDNTNIYYEAESPEERAWEVTRIWRVVNRLSLNIDKINFIVFRPYNKPMKHIYAMHVLFGVLKVLCLYLFF